MAREVEHTTLDSFTCGGGIGDGEIRQREDIVPVDRAPLGGVGRGAGHRLVAVQGHTGQRRDTVDHLAQQGRPGVHISFPSE